MFGVTPALHFISVISVVQTSTKGRSATLRGPKRILVSLPGEEKRFTS